MAPSINLKGLTTREAIADAAYRAVQGIDTYDLDLFKSALVDLNELSFEMNGVQMQGEDVILDSVFNFVGPLPTTHSLSNIRIDVDNDTADRACMTAYAVAVHYRKDEGMDPTTQHFTSAGIYTMDMIKDSNDGLWKIKKWAVKFVWFDGDRSITAREGFPAR
ncbi:hypothetical protein H2200_013101 [Cladophialophora chaetospira]|uniref:SnoaL-like domain-containing protein n=1 Tax=Cladophialophora chaetospira TaxID=386627 RepID=A0AA38WWR7_9EURO|nr:hypothetical protein H2200_013101 [Cladophialophora chaetospira]